MQAPVDGEDGGLRKAKRASLDIPRGPELLVLLERLRPEARQRLLSLLGNQHHLPGLRRTCKALKHFIDAHAHMCLAAELGHGSQPEWAQLGKLVQRTHHVHSLSLALAPAAASVDMADAYQSPPDAAPTAAALHGLVSQAGARGLGHLHVAGDGHELFAVNGAALMAALPVPASLSHLHLSGLSWSEAAAQEGSAVTDYIRSVAVRVHSVELEYGSRRSTVTSGSGRLGSGDANPGRSSLDLGPWTPGRATAESECPLPPPPAAATNGSASSEEGLMPASQLAHLLSGVQAERVSQATLMADNATAGQLSQLLHHGVHVSRVEVEAGSVVGLSLGLGLMAAQPIDPTGSALAHASEDALSALGLWLAALQLKSLDLFRLFGCDACAWVPLARILAPSAQQPYLADLTLSDNDSADEWAVELVTAVHVYGLQLPHLKSCQLTGARVSAGRAAALLAPGLLPAACHVQVSAALQLDADWEDCAALGVAAWVDAHIRKLGADVAALLALQPGSQSFCAGPATDPACAYGTKHSAPSTWMGSAKSGIAGSPTTSTGGTSSAPQVLLPPLHHAGLQHQPRSHLGRGGHASGSLVRQARNARSSHHHAARRHHSPLKHADSSGAAPAPLPVPSASTTLNLMVGAYGFKPSWLQDGCWATLCDNNPWSVCDPLEEVAVTLAPLLMSGHLGTLRLGGQGVGGLLSRLQGLEMAGDPSTGQWRVHKRKPSCLGGMSMDDDPSSGCSVPEASRTPGCGIDAALPSGQTTPGGTSSPVAAAAQQWPATMSPASPAGASQCDAWEQGVGRVSTMMAGLTVGGQGPGSEGAPQHMALRLQRLVLDGRVDWVQLKELLADCALFSGVTELVLLRPPSSDTGAHRMLAAICGCAHPRLRVTVSGTSSRASSGLFRHKSGSHSDQLIKLSVGTMGPDSTVVAHSAGNSVHGGTACWATTALLGVQHPTTPTTPATTPFGGPPTSQPLGFSTMSLSAPMQAAAGAATTTAGGPTSVSGPHVGSNTRDNLAAPAAQPQAAAAAAEPAFSAGLRAALCFGPGSGSGRRSTRLAVCTGPAGAGAASPVGSSLTPAQRFRARAEEVVAFLQRELAVKGLGPERVAVM
uniref:Uncharacterized protein n=1 Tax=Chlamydomonas leiostraca TaxID=1034604 RepID=A0A7S0RM97_9CHLO